MPLKAILGKGYGTLLGDRKGRLAGNEDGRESGKASWRGSTHNFPNIHNYQADICCQTGEQIDSIRSPGQEQSRPADGADAKS